MYIGVALLLASGCKKESIIAEDLVGRWTEHMTRTQVFQGTTMISDELDLDVCTTWKFGDEYNGFVGKNDYEGRIWWKYDTTEKVLQYWFTAFDYSIPWPVLYVRWESNDRIVLIEPVDGENTGTSSHEEHYLKRR